MDNLIILTEESRKSFKSKRKYKCPFCDKKYSRVELVNHIDNDHKDMISKDYTAARIVFNLVNRKDHGVCVIDHKETPWREDLWRYDRYCCEKCRKEGGKRAKANMMNSYGKESLLDDPEFQKKMLHNRGISGTYKFTHSGILDYVGSFEKKLLEFCDKVMNFKSSDFGEPPIIEYEYEGKKHFWITDYYLIPYNLVFDVKDGGDNPNTRDMKSYREKQICKENAIRELGKYNYIRLTNNNFAQLLLVLAELKEQMMDISDEKGPIIKINESFKNNPLNDMSFGSVDELCNAIMGAMAGKDKSSAYIVPYIQKGSFNQDYGITNDPDLQNMIITDENGNLIVKDFNFIDECEYSIYRYNKTPFKFDSKFKPSNLYEFVTGKELLTPDQLLYDEDLEKVLSNKEINKMTELCETALLKESLYNSIKIPVINESYIVNHPTIDFFIDSNSGEYFVVNNESGMRSPEYDSLDNIPKEIIEFVENNGYV